MHAETDHGPAPTLMKEHSLPRPQRRTAAIFAQYVQELVEAQARVTRLCGEAR